MEIIVVKSLWSVVTWINVGCYFLTLNMLKVFHDAYVENVVIKRFNIFYDETIEAFHEKHYHAKAFN